MVYPMTVITTTGVKHLIRLYISGFEAKNGKMRWHFIASATTKKHGATIISRGYKQNFRLHFREAEHAQLSVLHILHSAIR